MVSASLAGSAGRYAGGQTSLGYQYVRPEFSLDLLSTRALGDYGDLGSREDAPVVRQTDRATVSFPITRSQSMALSYIGYRQPDAPAAKLGSATYTVNLHSRVAMNLSAFHDFNQSDSNGVYLSLTLMMGDRTQAFASVSRQQRQDSYSVGAQRSVDYEGGAGWSVQRGRSGGQAYTQGQVQYLGRYGQLTGLAQDLGGRTQAAAQASGAVLMDGVVTPSRRINDSFALVSTGAPGVDVLHENRKLGKTDSSGHLLVPDLIPYQANRVSIDVENLPVDTRLESTKAVVVPQSRSGVVANFQLERYVAATVILKTPDGQFLPPGAGVLHAESGKRGGGLRRHDLRRGPAGAESPDGAGQGRVLPRAIRIWRRARPAIAHAGPVRLPAFGGAQAMRRAILLVAIVFAWAWAGAAQAQSNCNLSGSSTTIDFGAVNPLLPGDTLNSGG